MTEGATTATQTEATSSGPTRAFPAIAERVLVIGLDGATFTALDPLMAEGRMPRLKAAIEGGASGTLLSTIPPMTPAAWTTFLTGKQPGRHGILDFEGYDSKTGRLSFNSAQKVGHVRNIWQILSDLNFKVGSINVPMTYPPTPVNGFIVTGFETPGPHSEFASPPELKAEILKRWPDPTLKSKWRRKIGGGDKLFAENIAYLSQSFHQGVDMTTYLGDKYGWDVLMVVFKLVDNLQHKTWKYIDPRWSDRNPTRRDLTKACFEEADAAVGALLDYAAAYNATVLMVSDHGHGSLEGKVFPNRMLEKWGYLKLKGPATRLAARGKRAISRMLKIKAGGGQARGIEQHVPIDLPRSKACVMHAGNAAFLWLNLKGRQPTGLVEPSEYESLRREIMARFLGEEGRVRAPWGEDIQLFPEVYIPEELYGCSREEEPWMPDLLMIQHEVLAVVRRMDGRVARWLPYGRLEGTHRKEGVLIATGPGIVKGKKGVSAHLADCAPTILSMLGLRVPDDMSGRVVTELFEQAPTVETERAPQVNAPSGDELAYSEEDLKRVTERLADLGYLE